MSRPRNEGTPLGFGLTQERLIEDGKIFVEVE